MAAWDQTYDTVVRAQSIAHGGTSHQPEGGAVTIHADSSRHPVAVSFLTKSRHDEHKQIIVPWHAVLRIEE